MTNAISLFRSQLPLRFDAFDPATRPTGLVIVDLVNGFATVGAGALAPVRPDAEVAAMVAEVDRLARRFGRNHWPILAFLDTHEPGRPEPPYPPHCEVGSGEEELVEELRWLEDHGGATLVRKDCINAFVGALDPVSGRNAVVEWINRHGLETVLVTGMCTDICVMDFVLTLLSVRNHGLTPGLREVAVVEPACATYDLPLETARMLGLPDTAAHPREVSHHAGLYFMASRGARLVREVL